MKSLIFCFSIFYFSMGSNLFVSSAIAQTGDGGSSSDVSFRTLGWGVGKSNLFYFSDGDYLPLSISKGSLSGYHPYAGSQSFQVFRKVTDPETGDVSYVPFLESNLLGDASEQILVFFQSPTNPDVIRIFAYDDSMERMGDQAVFIGNFSPLDLAFQVNEEERFGLKPGQSRIIPHNGDPHAVVQIAAYREDHWQVEYRSSPRLRRGFRNYFFFRDMKGKSEVLDGISPIIYKESVARARKALEFPNGESETGRIQGSTVPFDPEAGF